MGPFDAGQVQIHDINPSDMNTPGEPQWFAAGGLFWTGRVDRDSVEAQRGEAEFELDRYPLFDFGDVANAVFRNPDGTPAIPAVPARSDVKVKWKGTGERASTNHAGGDNSEPFRARYERATVDVEWNARVDDGYWINCDSESDDDVHVTSAFMARVRNGVFV